MSINVTSIIGKKIKSLREKIGLTQQDLAIKMNMTRPGISNWENGKSEPSSSQLYNLSEIFNVSTDEILGKACDTKKAVIVDTSALIKRPSIVEELDNYFDDVIIPQVVIGELNNLKDKGKLSVKQRAWLVMKNIKEIGKNFYISPNKNENITNDEKIAEIAISRAQKKPFDDVYMLTDDIWFSFLTKEQKNLQTITPRDYVSIFHQIENKYDYIKTLDFIALVKNKKLQQVKAFNMKDVDVNFHDPYNGFTPLIAAVRNRDIQMIDYLLTLKTLDFDVLDKHKYHFSALHHATQLKNMEIIKKLVEAGADFDLGSGGKNKGNTPLMVAAWSHFTAGVDFFLSNGACTNQQDSNGYTPLIKSTIKHNIEIVKKLVRVTDTNIRSKENKKAIDYLNSQNPKSLEIIKLYQEVSSDR